MAYEQQDTEQALLEILRALRENPEKYQAVRRELMQAGSDEERVRSLLDFATSERELAALIPARSAEESEALVTVTTVTVTTVFVLEGSAY